jgi:glycosyltransferase involved in cell wall biosynthesis
MARVCMIVLTDYPADTRVRREAEALAARGDEVVVICPHTPALGDRREISGVRLHPVRSSRSSASDRPIHYLARYGTFMAAASVAALRLHLRRRYDVVHVHTMPDVLVYCAAGPKLLGAKVVLDVHDLMPELYRSKFQLDDSHTVIRALRFLERRSVAYADRAIAVHDPHLDALVAHGCERDRFTVVMNVPDTMLFQRRERAPDPPPFTLVYHGMIGRRNGLDVAVRAVAQARAEVPGLALRIVGDGDDADRIEDLIRELGVGDIVTLHRGLFPIEDLLPLLREATVGVVPILDDAFTRIMLPVKLLEYTALGLPVIVSSTDTVRAYFDDSMVCFTEPGDAGALARRIVELHGDAGRRAALAAGAARFGEEHSWEMERSRYYELIDELVASRTRRGHRRTAVSAQANMEVGGS